MVWDPGACPNVIMKRVSRREHLLKPGDFYWTDGDTPYNDGVKILEPGETRPRWIVYIDNRGSHGYVAIRPYKQNNGASWEWDGDWDKPTLTPSIHSQVEHPPGKRSTIWHGYIRGGVIGFEC